MAIVVASPMSLSLMLVISASSRFERPLAGRLPKSGALVCELAHARCPEGRLRLFVRSVGVRRHLTLWGTTGMECRVGPPQGLSWIESVRPGLRRVDPLCASQAVISGAAARFFLGCF
jgi:hypothetical protein